MKKESIVLLCNYSWFQAKNIDQRCRSTICFINFEEKNGL